MIPAISSTSTRVPSESVITLLVMFWGGSLATTTEWLTVQITCPDGSLSLHLNRAVSLTTTVCDCGLSMKAMEVELVVNITSTYFIITCNLLWEKGPFGTSSNNQRWIISNFFSLAMFWYAKYTILAWLSVQWVAWKFSKVDRRT